MGNYLYTVEEEVVEATKEAIENKDALLKEMLNNTVVLNEVDDADKKYSKAIEDQKLINIKKRKRKRKHNNNSNK